METILIPALYYDYHHRLPFEWAQVARLDGSTSKVARRRVRQLADSVQQTSPHRNNGPTPMGSYNQTNIPKQLNVENL